jgi:hypothetical protein
MMPTLPSINVAVCSRLVIDIRKSLPFSNTLGRKRLAVVCNSTFITVIAHDKTSGKASSVERSNLFQGGYQVRL